MSRPFIYPHGFLICQTHGSGCGSHNYSYMYE